MQRAPTTMNSDALHVPEDPLARFEELYRELLAGPGKAPWYEPREALRFSALSLVPIQGEPSALAASLREIADQLLRGTPWYGNLRTSVRFLVATMLLKHGTPVADFLSEVERADPLFRKHWRLSGNVYEALAVLLLMQHSADGKVSQEQVDRLQAIWQRMKTDHPWLTHKSDWPAAALLSTVEAAPEPIGERLEALYQALRAHRLTPGDSLQTASQILYFHPGRPGDVAERFAGLYSGFRDQGLWMHGGDYDELSLLTFTTQPEREVVGLVSSQRERIEALDPRPGKATSFNLACGTATLTLVGSERPEAVDQIQALATIHLLLQAQAASAMIIAGGATAAGASG